MRHRRLGFPMTKRELGCSIALGVGLALLMHWPLPLHVGSDVPRDLGDPLAQAWQIAWGGHALQHQPFEYWQANMYYPLENSLAFSDALVGYAPIGLIAEGFTAAIVRYDVLFIFAYALAFVGAYLLARELGARPAAAVVAGAAYAYAPWRLEQDRHLHVISSGGIPLALFLLVLGYRRGRWPPVLAGWLVAAWQLALGFTLGLMLAYLLAVLAVILIPDWRRERPARPVVLATSAGVAAFLAIAVLMALPYQQVRDDHPESERTPAEVASFSSGPSQFAAAPQANLFWGPVTADIRDQLGAFSEQTLFPGILAPLLAAVGLFSRVSPFGPRLRVGVGLGVIALAWLSLGFRVPGDGFPYPYRLVYDWAPGWDAVRTPGRLNTLISLGLALLAAAGAHRVLSGKWSGTEFGFRRPLETALAFALPAIVLLEGCGFEVAKNDTLLAGPPLGTVPMPPKGLVDATSPRVHLPMNLNESRFLVWSTNGFPKIVNGSGSFTPRQFEQLEREMAGFPTPPLLSKLSSIGVKTVVVQPDIIAGTPWKDWRSWTLRGEQTGGVVLYRLSR